MAVPLQLTNFAWNPPHQADKVFGFVICDTMIRQAIVDGSHAALHSITQIQRYRALGRQPAHEMRKAWTKAHQLQLIPGSFVDGHASRVHYRNWSGLHPTVPAPQDPHPAVVEICEGCEDCFTMLLEAGVLTYLMFLGNWISPLVLAAKAGNIGIMRLYVENLPSVHFWHCLRSKWPLPGMTLLKVCRSNTN
jgi:hypothetical protein